MTHRFTASSSVLLAALLLPLVVACATNPSGPRMLAVETRSAGIAVDGAICTVQLGKDGLTVTTPALVPVGGAQGDLEVTCNKPGYRTSALRFSPVRSSGSSLGIGAGGGGGHVGLGLGMSFPIGGAGSSEYPPRVTLELTPQ